MMTQIDQEGWDTRLLKEIVSFRKYKSIALSPGENNHTTVNRFKRPIITTKGWDIQVQWTDR